MTGLAFKPFEIKTPDLITARDALKHALIGIMSNGMEPKQANVIVSAANGLRGAVATDLRVRLAQPRLIEAEMKAAAAA